MSWLVRVPAFPSARLSIVAQVHTEVPRVADLLLFLVCLKIPIPELTVMPMMILPAWLHALELIISSLFALINNDAANSSQFWAFKNNYLGVYKIIAADENVVVICNHSSLMGI